MKVPFIWYFITIFGISDCHGFQPSARGTSDQPSATLDLSKKNNSVGTYHSKVLDNKTIQTFLLYSVTATKVVEGDDTIWEAEGEERCLYAQITVEGGLETLVLKIKTDREAEVKFRREDGQWTNTSGTAECPVEEGPSQNQDYVDHNTLEEANNDSC
ncbi:signal peptide containing protein [Theileria equi strain WA]|uniref:Signal peptide containing protein n=1 Tax=Theileria equi strain WA TaxID=1537102 RepID=L1LBN9_THEEQ|nr:signal peptide containing protein [Theileria equi strain WA]EKX72593.1 signal peptide containing protein [Theileria equi strain WA]|eukprot:XP_004832045.1 signal peptide containing protein [Theileria equi strain WA]